MNRKHIQELCIAQLNAIIEKEGEDKVFMRSTSVGKNTWTNKEALESVKEDRNLENGPNLIDDYIVLLNWKRDHEC